MNRHIFNRIFKRISIIFIALIMQSCLATKPRIGVSATGNYAETKFPSVKLAAKCVQSGIDDPYLITLCALGGGLAGAEMLNSFFIAESDYDLHYDVLITHLNSDKIFSGSSYTNWYNKNTGNNGIIHTTSVHFINPDGKITSRARDESSIKCVSYSVTVDITLLGGFAGIDRRVEHGVACQLPDGKWVEKPIRNPYTGRYE